MPAQSKVFNYILNAKEQWSVGERQKTNQLKMIISNEVGRVARAQVTQTVIVISQLVLRGGVVQIYSCIHYNNTSYVY